MSGAGTHSILLIEDDARIASLVCTQLRELGYKVHWHQTGAGGFQHLNDNGHGNIDLIVLDLMLPDMDGLDWCSRVRAEDRFTPILMLTAKAETSDVVRGLEYGADDYLTKPFESAELLARLHALLRRAEPRSGDSPPEGATPVVRRGGVEIDSERHKVTLNGQRVQLTAKEYELLCLFADNPGRAFDREELLNTVWGEEFDGFDHTVNTHINRLRYKIEPDPTNPHYILTVWGVGYRFAEADELSA